MGKAKTNEQENEALTNTAAKDFIEEEMDDDDEFMTGIDEEKRTEEKSKKLTPEQAKERKKFLIGRNAELVLQKDEKQKVAELRNHPGVNLLYENIENRAIDEIREMRSDRTKKKDATDSIKDLDAVNIFKELVGIYNASIRSIEDEIARNEKEIQSLGACQLGLLDE